MNAYMGKPSIAAQTGREKYDPLYSHYKPAPPEKDPTYVPTEIEHPIYKPVPPVISVPTNEQQLLTKVPNYKPAPFNIHPTYEPESLILLPNHTAPPVIMPIYEPESKIELPTITEEIIEAGPVTLYQPEEINEEIKEKILETGGAKPIEKTLSEYALPVAIGTAIFAMFS